jgi:hypothetical protein
MIKKFVASALLLVALLALAACGGSSEEYKSDVATADIAEQVSASLESDSLIAMDESYLTNAMQLDPTMFADYTVMVNSKGVNIDEFGIFKAPDADSVAEVEEAIKGYLQLRIDTWMPEYMPEEYPKLENAEVTTCGQYVMYAILADDSAQTAFAELETALKA